MVAGLFRLRVALLFGAFRGSFTQGLRAIGLILLSLVVAVLAAAVPVWTISDPRDRAVIDTAIGAAVLIATFAVPFFDWRRNLLPRQFVQFPVSSGKLAAGLLLTSWVSWSFLVLVTWLAAWVWFRMNDWVSLWPAVAGAVGAAVLAVLLARVGSALSALWFGERFAGAVRTAGWILLIAALPVVIFAAATTFRAEGVVTLSDTTAALAWTPFGAPFAVPGLFAGDEVGALLSLAVLFGAILLLIIIWVLLVRASNVRIERPRDPEAARSGLGWFERFPARPAPVIAARELTYWARDPRYRVALFAVPIAPVVMLVALWIAGAGGSAIALIPLPVVLLLLAWSQHNDVAMDSTAIWTHVASGTRGRDDRSGRLAPVLMIGVPLALIGSSITVTLMGDWRALPAVLGLNIAVLLVTAGVTSVFSVLMPYPTTRPGDSPFVQPQWSGSGAGLAQAISMLTALVLCVAPVWFSVAAITDVEFIANIWALVFGIGYGLAVLFLGIVIGGRIFDRSGPELIAVTQVFD